ncbi:MAG TPA: family 20 glycosylhydrolase [Candidatus Gemmiger excrementavium]|uniref:beta-N-acetylhexosaminidase n=1 Tax=Candidatus Gemmiger excrementavium TaxID=2838608 RepID=A0A9D2F3T9_9FIRM|nr:family 20 glycosylhydrolase [Candidatus Gemmiger excrementavium]
MDFLPQPKRAETRPGSLTLTPHTRIVLCPGTAPEALLYAQMLRDAVRDQAGLCPALGRGKAAPGDIALCIDTALPATRYTLAVTPEGVRLAAGDDEALCNGVQTLIQYLEQKGAVLPALEVEDWPDLPNRGYYQDCSRGRVPKMSYLKRVADLLCRYKVNQWQLYIEHTYLFRDLSEAWRDDTPLTADDILELDAYCAARHIELVPSLASFGHMYKILSTKTCCDYCELPDSEKIPFSYTYAGAHHTLNVSNPDVVDFVKKLIDEYRPLFRSRKFNICADETFDLGKGRSKSLADELGEKTLYVRHVKALCEYLVSQGCTPMFWGDIMWRFPQSCAELPKETICLNWGYLPNQRENEIRDIAASGITQYACPGVCGWNRWVPLYRYSYSNIRAMCHHAHKYHAIGLLNTDWGDYAHINDPRLTIPGILYGAAFGWNAQPVEMDELNEAVSRIEYGDTSGTLMAALTDLSDHEVFDWQHAVNWMDGDEARRAELLAELDLTQVPAANAAVADALARITACAATLPAGRKEIISLAAVTAESVTLWNQIGAWLAGPRTEDPALAARLEHWYALYLAQWRQVSRESGLPNLTLLITRYADLLRGRQLRAG